MQTPTPHSPEKATGWDSLFIGVHIMLAAYESSATYNFRLLITRNGDERTIDIQTDSLMFCNVCAAFRQLKEWKGWAILESWEVPA
jgi:hypothetical protein